MSTLRFMTFTDVHISSVNPQSRRGDYLGDILDKLKQIRDVGQKLGAQFYLCGGDLFNLKAPMKNPHSLNRTLIELFRSFKGDVYTTEGNHDLRFDSYETFNEQPLAVLYQSGALLQLRESVITHEGVSVRIRSFPFEEEPDLESLPKAKDDVDLNVCVLHLYSSPQGGMLYKHKLFSYPEISSLGDDIFLLGHYHVDQGIETLGINGKDQTFINLGALSRGSLVEDNIQRTPRIGYVEITKTGDEVKVSTKAIRLKVKPATEVFDLEEKDQEQKKLKEAEEFVEKLKDDSFEEDLEGEDRVVAALDKLKIDKKVLEKVSYFLTSAHEELEKISS
ncbi:MAG: hypothetical protein GF334_06205 [Candidatus Altiarchaeales archaeon]|nr:hypothetical protein [Candidatus Altiarchaeales archaeon]